MDNVCGHCGAKRFATENKSICCANGQVQLQAIPEAPPPLKQSIIKKIQALFLERPAAFIYAPFVKRKVPKDRHCS